MSRRRSDPLADTRRPHWLLISDLHRNPISCAAVAIGADLRVVLRQALEALAADGWQAEHAGEFGFVFVTRGSERRLVNLTLANPSIGIGAGHSFLASQDVINQRPA